MLLRQVAPTVARSIHGVRVATMATSSKPTQSVIVHLHVNDLRTTDSPALSLAHSQQKKHVTHFLPLYVFDERILPLDYVPGYSVSAQTKAIEKMTTVDKSSDDEIKPLGQEDEPIRTSNNQPATKDRKDRPNGRIGPRSRLGNFWRVGRHRAKFLVETVFDLKRSYEGKGGGMLLACGKPEEVAIRVVEALVKSGVKVDGVYTQKEVSLWTSR
jgi:deoxyribodipyrimidine photo-lyase